MIQVDKEDVVRGLKKFKRLAKQDLLASHLTSNPQFWTRQAEARRSMYEKLMNRVESEGVDETYEKAILQYASLPLTDFNSESDPELRGTIQALEMFFTILGLDVKQLRSERRNTTSESSREERAVMS